MVDLHLIQRGDCGVTIWAVRVKKDGELTTWYEQSLSHAVDQKKFILKCMERLSVAPARLPREEWERQFITALARGIGLVP